MRTRINIICPRICQVPTQQSTEHTKLVLCVRPIVTCIWACLLASWCLRRFNKLDNTHSHRANVDGHTDKDEKVNTIRDINFQFHIEQYTYRTQYRLGVVAKYTTHKWYTSAINAMEYCALVFRHKVHDKPFAGERTKRDDPATDRMCLWCKLTVVNVQRIRLRLRRGFCNENRFVPWTTKRSLKTNLKPPLHWNMIERMLYNFQQNFHRRHHHSRRLCNRRRYSEHPSTIRQQTNSNIAALCHNVTQ